MNTWLDEVLVAVGMTRDVVSTSVSRCSPVTGDATRTTCEPSKPLFRPPEMTPPRRQRVASHVRVDNGATTPLEAADRGALEPCTTASLVDRNLFRVANQSTDVKLHEYFCQLSRVRRGGLVDTVVRCFVRSAAPPWIGTSGAYAAGRGFRAHHSDRSWSGTLTRASRGCWVRSVVCASNARRH